MKKYYSFLIAIFSIASIFAQHTDTSFKYIDPFSSFDQFNNYNPQTIDFSKEFYKQSVWVLLNEEKAKDVTSLISRYNISQLWLKNSKDNNQNGIIGKNYKRIRIHFSKVIKDSLNPLIYWAWGKSKVGNNICDFKGRFKIIKILRYPKDSEIPGGGEIFGSYKLNEDSSQSYSGSFKGIFNSTYNIDTAKSKIYLDESMSIADGYSNNVFVGTWTEYKNGNQKKCIWSDYRLPYCFDFDEGTGEMYVNKKYEKNGWKSFNDNSEYIYNKQKKTYELKNKWWVNQK